LTQGSWRYRFEPDGQAGIDAVLEKLATRFAVVPGPSRTVRRTWLDTFDWRLHKAGHVLEYAESGADRVLALQSGDGGQLSAPVAALDWPCLVDALPDMPLRQRLADAAWIRALMPVAEGRDRVRDVDLRNRDDKIVARLVVETATSGPRGAWLTVIPVRGYPAQARRAARLLESAAGVTRTDASPYADRLARTGRSPGAEPGKVRLDREMPAPAAVATVLTGFLDEMAANSGGVIADVDTEFLHDFRVAVRRTRSTLKLAGSVLPDPAEAYAEDFRWLGDVTTPTRDFDVHLLGFAEMARWLTSADPAELAPFHQHLQKQRATERRKLVRTLRSARCTRLLGEWRAVLARAAGAPAKATAGELAASTIGRAYRRVVRLGSAITPGSPAEDLHTLRKRGKELRYALEMFASLYDGATHRAAVQDLKGLQDCLGRFQDSEVQRDAIAVFAEQMMAAGTAPASTVLAMGELAAHLDADQARARDEFAGRFAQFVRRGNQRRMAALTAGPPA
jgi:CHAD domain-containing protein